MQKFKKKIVKKVRGVKKKLNWRSKLKETVVSLMLLVGRNSDLPLLNKLNS